MTRPGKAAAVIILILISCLSSCKFPNPPTPTLTAAAVRYTLNDWNPQYCKVIEFYGLHQPAAANTRLAYVLLANPKDPEARPVLYVAHFQLLNRPDGTREWFLTSLLTHAGGITRPQGWDNLLVPVKAPKAKGGGGS